MLHKPNHSVMLTWVSGRGVVVYSFIGEPMMTNRNILHKYKEMRIDSY